MFVRRQVAEVDQLHQFNVVTKAMGKCGEDGTLQLLRRQSPAGVICLRIHQPVRDVIPIANAGLDGVRRGEPVAGLIEHQPGQDAGRSDILGDLAVDSVAGQGRLNGVPSLAIDDRVMEASEDLAFMGDVADIKGIGQELVKISSRERPPSLDATVRQSSLLGHDPGVGNSLIPCMLPLRRKSSRIWRWRRYAELMLV